MIILNKAETSSKTLNPAYVGLQKNVCVCVCIYMSACVCV